MSDVAINNAVYTLKMVKEYNEIILEKIVIERIKYTHKNYFILEEILYLSEIFSMDIDKMLLCVLGISQEDYCRLIKNNLRRIYSKKYIEIKKVILKKKRNHYLKKINLNKRNYYNKQRIMEDAQSEEVNYVDFVTEILGKGICSMWRVVKDDSNKSRLYVGKYKNCALPLKYYYNNYNEMQPIIKKSVWGFFKRFNIRYNKSEFEDMVQNSNLYLMECGNGLNKYNKPIIKEHNKFRNKHKKMLYNKSLYYLMNNMKNRRSMEAEYDDGRAIKGLTSGGVDGIDTRGLTGCSDDVEAVFNEMFTDEKENRIFRGLIKYANYEDRFERGAKDEGLTVDEVERLYEERRKELCGR